MKPLHATNQKPVFQAASRWLPAAGLGVLLSVSGCTNSPETVGAAPATPDQYQAIRAELTSQRAGTQVGPITAVLPEENLASAGDLETDRFFLGDLVSIIDSAQNTLAFGKVKAIRSGEVHVQYTSEPNARPPAVGDLVVRFPR